MKPNFSLCVLFLCLQLVACTEESEENKKHSITFLHMGDHRSHLDAERHFSLMLSGSKFYTEAGGFPRIVKKIKQLRAEYNHTFSVHTGDAITGDVYYNLFKGQADAVLMNEVCFDAVLLGNQELNFAEAGLIKFLNFLKTRDCNTPMLSANLIPKVGISKLARYHRDEYIRPYVIKYVDNWRVAFIGLSNINKLRNSSLVTNAYGFMEEQKTAQGYINLLKKRGIKHFILLTDQSYAQDMRLAQSLTDVDVIIGGDSKTLLGQFADYGLNRNQPYPSITKNKSGQTVCVVESWQKSLAVGELSVQFNANGEVENCTGQMNLLFANQPIKSMPENSSKHKLTQAEAQNLLASDTQISFIDEDENARKKLDAFSVNELRGRQVGLALDTLCLDWLPGSKRSKLCSPEDTALRGSDITSLVVQSFLAFIPQADIAIQNAGGVRADIKKGIITAGDIYRLLPYGSKLVLIKITGKQIKALLEDVIDVSMNKRNEGAYPYAANLRWHVYALNEKGQRVQNLQYKDRDSEVWYDMPENKVFKLIANDFITQGNDGYKRLKAIKNSDKTNTYIDYSEIFFEYLRIQENIQKPERADYSTQGYFLQNFSPKKSNNKNK